LGRTFLYTVVSVPLSVGGGLGLALLLNRRLRAVGLYRTIFYVPSVVPVVASAVMWKIMFDRDAGIINALIELFGGPAITWLLDPTAFTVLVIMTLWGLGGGMVIFLAGLQGIPGELREAAAVDGANAVQTFRAVVLPLLTPVVLFQVVTGVIAALQTLVQPLLLAESGGTAAVGDVPRSNFLYMVNVYQQFFANQRFGYGAALLWVLFAVLLLITVLVLRSSTLWVYYEVDQGKGG
jgi:multiple sugar transport system permease protein